MREAANPGKARVLGRREFVAYGLVAAGTLMLSACQNPAGGAASSNGAREEISDTRFFFDTVCLIRGVMERDTLEGAFELCDFFQKTLSAQEEGSDIDLVNRANGESVQVHPETAELVRAALRYCEESGGLFDITIGAASLLWDFKEGVVPDAAELAEAVKHIDYTQVRVEGDTIQLLDPRAKIDVGGVAKGYIADKLIEYLQKQGVQSGFVNLGGNVKTLGTKPDGSPWAVGVQDPNAPPSSLNDSSSAIAKVDSTGSSVVTSGLYERAFELDGKRYWHILDPKTGYPVETDVVSATIVSDESIDGDGYTKSLFMWGADSIESFFKEHPELQGLVIRADGTMWESPNATFVLR